MERLTAMARGSSEVTAIDVAGVVYAPIDETGLKGNGRVFAGGQPVANEDRP